MAHVPIRSCCGCRERRPKAELLRIFADADGRLRWDEKMKSSGRGAYICRNAECFRTALKKRSFERTLRRRGLVLEAEEMQLFFHVLGHNSLGGSGEIVHGENLGR